MFFHKQSKSGILTDSLFDQSLVRISVPIHGQLLENHLLCSLRDLISQSCSLSQSLIYFDQVGGDGRK